MKHEQARPRTIAMTKGIAKVIQGKKNYGLVRFSRN